MIMQSCHLRRMQEFKKLSVFSLNAAVDVETVGPILRGLGKFTPEDIVTGAKSETSPLHKYFEWDDAIAGHAYRLTQARHLVLAVGLEGSDMVRAFESVVIEGSRFYVPIDKIRGDQDLITQVLQSAINEMRYWGAKYQKYKDFFGGVFDAIDEAEETYRRKYGKTKKGRGGGKRSKVHNTANKKDRRKHHDHRR